MEDPVIVRNVARKDVPRLKKRNQIPDEIILNKELNLAIDLLPSNYNFEVHKTIWRIKKENFKLVALQFPEGLLMYSCILSDIIGKYANCKTLIMGDVTYGACCVDDFTARKLGADFLVHYGHSCLVPINTTSIKVLYVFVEILFDTTHLIEVIKANFPITTRLALMGTIQFTNMVNIVANALQEEYSNLSVPQAKPLSGGETLGCTAPLLSTSDVLLFVADGRFHLEAAMIRNPQVISYRYDPYSKCITTESYDIILMKQNRWEAISKAKVATNWGVILGTLGRQGSPEIFHRIRALLHAAGKNVIPFLMAELNPKKIAVIPNIDVACPRLSIDWGAEFTKPLLNSYELEVAVGAVPWQEVYPMDYYSNDGGLWANMPHRQLLTQTQRPVQEIAIHSKSSPTNLVV